MDWVSHLATAIAIFRLILICCGMWIQLRTISRRGVVNDNQRRFFAMAGIIYLLGLMPQSLLLLLVSSDLMTAMLDSGYLCTAQKLVCSIAVAFHNLIFLNWLLEYIGSLDVGKTKGLISIVRHKTFAYISTSYVFMLILCRGYFMHNGDGKTFYTDIASKSYNGSIGSSWTSEPAEIPSQVIRLQLLLCESSLEENEVLNYLFVSYAFMILPLFLMGIIIKWKLSKKQASPDPSTEPVSKTVEGEEQCPWWEREENIQRFLSTFITMWFHIIQPIIFCTHREHFVDFGVHLVLTVCVFIPWSLSDDHYNQLRSWV